MHEGGCEWRRVEVEGVTGAWMAQWGAWCLVSEWRLSSDGRCGVGVAGARQMYALCVVWRVGGWHAAGVCVVCGYCAWCAHTESGTRSRWAEV